MKLKFQIITALSVLVVSVTSMVLISIIAKNTIERRIIEQAINDNLAIGQELVVILKKTGLDKDNPEIDTILQQVCQEIKIPNNGFLCIVDSNQNMVACPGLKPGMTASFDVVLESFDNKGEIAPSSLAKAGIFNGYAHFKREGRTDVVVSMAINENLRLFIHQNIKIIESHSWEYVKPLLLLGLLASIIVCMIAYFSTNRLIISHNQIAENKNKDFELSVEENKKLKGQISELEDVRQKLMTKQKEEIEEIRKNITDSIRYAKRIQDAALSKKAIDNSFFSEHFIFFMPRDIVSGDFYWYHDFEDFFIIAVADCTGHGVPGAFMSMIGITFLNEIILDEQVYNAAKILEQMRKDVMLALDQSNVTGGPSDGIDISVCIFDKKKKTVQFAGAYHPLILIRNGSMAEIKGDRMPVGIYGKMNENFTNHDIEIEKNDVIYLFSDGYADQFGGSKGRKFLNENFKKLLFEIHDIELNKQHLILKETIIKWKGDNQQVDDISVIGLKIS